MSWSKADFYWWAPTASFLENYGDWSMSSSARSCLRWPGSSWPALLGLNLPSFPVEIKYTSRRKDIFGNVTLFSFLLGAASAAKCQGKKYPSNLEWIPDRPWCLQSCQREPSAGKPNMKKVHYSTSRDVQIIRHSGIYDFPPFRWSAAQKVPLPFPLILSFLLHETTTVIKRSSHYLEAASTPGDSVHTGSLGLESSPSWLVWGWQARKSDTLHLADATGVLIWLVCLCQSLPLLTALTVKIFTEKYLILPTGLPFHKEVWAYHCTNHPSWRIHLRGCSQGSVWGELSPGTRCPFSFHPLPHAGRKERKLNLWSKLY